DRRRRAATQAGDGSGKLSLRIRRREGPDTLKQARSATMNEANSASDLMRLVNGYQVSQAIHVAATLGIADLLKDGPRCANDLAAATGTHPGSLYRLLRALAAVGVFR